MGGFMAESDSFTHWLVAFRGRRRGAENVTFEDGQLVAQGREFQVSLLESAYYFNLPANTFAVITLPKGELQEVKGGLYLLQSGRYQIQYVTSKELTGETGLISEITIDGANVSVSVFFKYRVLNPLLVIGTSEPLKMLIKSLEVDIREYIRANTHQSIWDASRSKGDRSLSRFLRQQPNSSARSRALYLTDSEMQVFNPDPKFLEFVRNSEVLGKQNDNDLMVLAQKQTMERRLAEQDALIKKMKLDAAAEQLAVSQQMELKSIEVENKRRAWQRQYDSFSKVVQAVSDAVSNGQSLNAEIMTTLSALTDALRGGLDDGALPPGSPDHAPVLPPVGVPRAASTGNHDKVEKLTNTLLTLLRPKG
jgi:hypothetical protein